MPKNSSDTYVPDAGWTGRGFTITHAPVDLQQVTLTLAPRGKAPVAVAGNTVEAADGAVKITTDDFNYRTPWTLTVGADSYTRADMDDERCEGLEKFEKMRDGGVICRLYTPRAAGPRLLLLFLHGGADVFVPVSMCKACFDACGGEKKMAVYEGAAHAQSHFRCPEAYERDSFAFIQSVMEKGENIDRIPEAP